MLPELSSPKRNSGFYVNELNATSMPVIKKGYNNEKTLTTLRTKKSQTNLSSINNKTLESLNVRDRKGFATTNRNQHLRNKLKTITGVNKIGTNTVPNDASQNVPQIKNTEEESTLSFLHLLVQGVLAKKEYVEKKEQKSQNANLQDNVIDKLEGALTKQIKRRIGINMQLKQDESASEYRTAYHETNDRSGKNKGKEKTVLRGINEDLMTNKSIVINNQSTLIKVTKNKAKPKNLDFKSNVDLIPEMDKKEFFQNTKRRGILLNSTMNLFPMGQESNQNTNALGFLGVNGKVSTERTLNKNKKNGNTKKQANFKNKANPEENFLNMLTMHSENEKGESKLLKRQAMIKLKFINQKKILIRSIESYTKKMAADFENILALTYDDNPPVKSTITFDNDENKLEHAQSAFKLLDGFKEPKLHQMLKYSENKNRFYIISLVKSGVLLDY